MAFRFLTILTGRNLPRIIGPEPSSTINEKMIADFTRIVEQTGILRQPGGVKAHARTHPPPPS